MMLSSGSIYYPQAPGADAGADAQMIVVENNLGRLVSMSFRDTAAALSLGADRDWFIGSNYISQSRNASTGEGRTVFIADSFDENGSISVDTHILIISQSGTSPLSKVRIQGLNDRGDTTDNSVLVVDSNGDLYLTGSYGVGGTGGGSDNLGDHTATEDLDMGGFSINNVESITVTSITSSHITSSTINTSGSNIFGDVGDDTHEFIGSITASLDISSSGTIIANELQVDNFSPINISASGDLDVGGTVFQTTQEYIFKQGTLGAIASAHLYQNVPQAHLSDDTIYQQYANAADSRQYVEGINVLHSGSITGMKVDYTLINCFFMAESCIAVSASVFRSGSGVPGPFYTDATGFDGDAAYAHDTLVPISTQIDHAQHGFSGSLINLYSETGPILPEEVFGSSAVTKAYFGRVSWERTYNKGTHKVHPGDRLKVNIFKSKTDGSPAKFQDSFMDNQGGIQNIKITLEVSYDRSGSYGNYYPA